MPRACAPYTVPYSRQAEVENMITLVTQSVLEPNEGESDAFAVRALASLHVVMELSEDLYSGRGVPSINAASEHVVRCQRGIKPCPTPPFCTVTL